MLLPSPRLLLALLPRLRSNYALLESLWTRNCNNKPTSFLFVQLGVICLRWDVQTDNFILFAMDAQAVWSFLVATFNEAFGFLSEHSLIVWGTLLVIVAFYALDIPGRIRSRTTPPKYTCMSLYSSYSF